MNNDERYQLKLAAARMYYLEDKKQAEIAEILNISKPTLIKMIKEVKEEGIVRIEICDIRKLNRHIEIENELKERLNLWDVKVVDVVSGDRDFVRPEIGKCAAPYIQQLVKSNMRIGIGWGKTLEEVAKNVTPVKNATKVRFMPILGGPGSTNDCSMFANNLCERIASNFSGATVEYIYAPLFAESTAAHDVYMSLPNIQQALREFDNLDMSIVAIDGDSDHSTTLEIESAKNVFIDEESYSKIAGNICARFYDVDGKPCITSTYDRIIAITPEQLKKTPTVIAVGGGEHKVKSIIGGSRARLFNILITDYFTAKSVIAYLGN